MKAVIDTNVIISSVLSEGGKPADVMSLFYSGKLQIFYTSEIFSEYKRVLAYKKLNIDAVTQNDIINAVEVGGTLIETSKSDILMPDESDRIFYDAAKASEAVLITGNLKHYPPESFVMNPTDFLRGV